MKRLIVATLVAASILLGCPGGKIPPAVVPVVDETIALACVLGLDELANPSTQAEVDAIAQACHATADQVVKWISARRRAMHAVERFRAEHPEAFKDQKDL